MICARFVIFPNEIWFVNPAGIISKNQGMLMGSVGLMPHGQLMQAKTSPLIVIGQLLLLMIGAANFRGKTNKGCSDEGITSNGLFRKCVA